MRTLLILLLTAEILFGCASPSLYNEPPLVPPPRDTFGYPLPAGQIGVEMLVARASTPVAIEALGLSELDGGPWFVGDPANVERMRGLLRRSHAEVVTRPMMILNDGEDARVSVHDEFAFQDCGADSNATQINLPPTRTIEMEIVCTKLKGGGISSRVTFDHLQLVTDADGKTTYRSTPSRIEKSAETQTGGSYLVCYSDSKRISYVAMVTIWDT